MFWEAICERTPLEFDYRRSGTDKVTTRHLQPWGVTRYSGRWYAVGFDTDRGAERVFRLSRVQGAARKVGPAGVLRDPRGHRHQGGLPAAGPGTDLRARPSCSPAAAPRGRCAGPPTASRRTSRARTTARGWDRLVLSRGGVGLAEEVLGFGADVFVEESARLRDEVVGRLREAVS